MLPDRKPESGLRSDSDSQSDRTNERTNGQKRSGPITADFLSTAVDAHAHTPIREWGWTDA